MFVKISIFTFISLLITNPAFGNDNEEAIPIAAFSEGLKIAAKFGQNSEKFSKNQPVFSGKWESKRHEFSLEDNRYLFKEYAADTFSQLRSVFGIEHQDYFVTNLFKK